MDDQSRPVEPEDGQSTEDAGRNARGGQGAGTAAEQSAKSRAAYLDPRGSESTRELRDTARRRRDAEEKLQQHLMEAKEHVPNEFHEHPGHGFQGRSHAGDEHLDQEQSRHEHHEQSGQEQPGQGDAATGHQDSDASERRTEGNAQGGVSGTGE